MERLACSKAIRPEGDNGKPARLQLVATGPEFQALSPSFKLPLATNTSGAGALAFGAPGLNAFSNNIGEACMLGKQ